MEDESNLKQTCGRDAGQIDITDPSVLKREGGKVTYTNPEGETSVAEDKASLTPEDYKEYFQCTALRAGWIKDDIEAGKSSFQVNQEELMLHKAQEIKDESQPSGKRIHTEFGIYTHQYHCDFVKSDDFNPDKPTLLICIRENLKLLTYTLDNLHEFDVDQEANVMVIEDGNNSNPKLDGFISDIQRLTSDRKHSYLSVTYGRPFSFSMLNNIGAAIVDGLGGSEIVLWNSDLWAADSSTFPEILRLHRESNADVSGAKLLYPEFDWGGDEFKATDFYFPSATKGNAHKGKCQHAGIFFTIVPVLKRTQYMPQHEGRFAEKDDPLVNCDKGTYAVTGAFQVIKLDTFKKLGGMNPCLDRGFQDIDFCLRCDRVMYFGKDRYFYHNESVSLFADIKEKEDDEAVKHAEALFNCGIIYSKVWNIVYFSEKILFKPAYKLAHPPPKENALLGK